MNIDIICPLYNGDIYIDKLYKSIIKQKKVNINKIKFILTNTSDNSETILNDLNVEYEKIEKKNFSHSLVREKAGLVTSADIIVFISQDIIIEDDFWLYNLTKDIVNGICHATYSRQISKYNNIEKYTREKNYPNYSFVKDKNDLSELGLNTFFFSDASSAINSKIFKKLNGYDGKDLLINEDMYFAYKLIMNDYKIKYCSDSIIYHSHNLSFKQLYNRYYETGMFFKQNDYLNNYKINKTGGTLAFYILKRCLEDRNIKVLFRFFPDMIVRFVAIKRGMKNG